MAATAELYPQLIIPFYEEDFYLFSLQARFDAFDHSRH